MSKFRRQLMIANTGAAPVPPVPPGPTVPYLCFEAIESGTFTLTIPANSTLKVTNISYSLDGGNTWVSTDIVSGSAATITTPSISAGDKVYWKGTAVTFAASSSVYSRFTSDGKFNVSGNIMSLKNGDDISNTMSDTTVRIFSYLFSGSKVVDASALILPISSVGNYGYYYMFSSCIELTAAPALPATSMGTYGYGYMFIGCTALTTAPDLHITAVPNYGYRSMFQNCSSLSSIKITTTSVNSNSLTNWMANVASTGTFTKPSSLTLSSGASGIPNNWTVIDI